VAEARVEAALVCGDLALRVHETAGGLGRAGTEAGAGGPNGGAHGVPLVAAHVLAPPVLLRGPAELLAGRLYAVLALAGGGLAVELQCGGVRALLACWGDEPAVTVTCLVAMA